MDKNTIIIVSGVPRSGTSMMMKILQAGGMELLIDNSRQADTNNPNGYFEYEKVKIIEKDNSWLSFAKGKVVKVLFNFLYFLPQTYKFKVVFMQRDLEEVIASQNKMLKDLGKKSATSNAEMSVLFKNEIDICLGWLDTQKNIDMLNVNYNNAIKNPAKICKDIQKFVSQELDAAEMVKTIDRLLYRNKNIFSNYQV